VEELLKKLKERFAEEKDLRVLGREVLAGHMRVKHVNFGETSLEFTMADEARGKIDREGRLFTGGSSYDDWIRYPPPKPASKSGGWEAGKKGDMDDDIPF
jgi:hypothetical protein